MLLNQIKHNSSAKRLFLVFIIFGIFFLSDNSIALTVEEIIKLKEAGVSDELIEKLIEKEESEKQKTKIEVPQPKTTVSIHNAYEGDPVLYRFDGQNIDITYAWHYDETDMQVLWGFSEIPFNDYSKHTIHPGNYFINYYVRQRVAKDKRALVDKGKYKKRLSFFVKEGDKIEIHLNQHPSVSLWNALVTINVFRNEQRILRKRLEGGL